jgi:hypothetical protein
MERNVQVYITRTHEGEVRVDLTPNIDIPEDKAIEVMEKFLEYENKNPNEKGIGVVEYVQFDDGQED